MLFPTVTVVFYRCETGIEPTLTNNKWTVQVEINRLLIYPKKQKTINFHPDNRKFERGKKGSKML
jgi:hypothetical protein